MRVTAIFLPLNLITCLFGMKSDALQLIDPATGPRIAFGLMAAQISIGLTVFFLRKRYLGTSPCRCGYSWRFRASGGLRAK